MRFRTSMMNLAMLSVATLGLGLALLLTGSALRAETIAVDDKIAVKEPGMPSPTRGMTMEQVESKFGQPASKTPAVGKPPITRWDYPGYAVYFEFNHVVHSVASSS